MGSAAAFGEVLTLPALEAALRSVFERAGGEPHADFRRPGAVEAMHELRNDVLFALSSSERRRQQCGRPAQ